MTGGPGLRALVGTLAWSAIMAASAFAWIARSGWQLDGRAGEIILIFAIGGAAAFLPAVLIAKRLSRGRPDTGFASAFLVLAVATLGLTALLYGLQYREYYATWHGPVGSKLWLNQFVFTTLSGVYQFLVLGLRMFLPLGLPALIVASMVLARTARSAGVTRAPDMR